MTQQASSLVSHIIELRSRLLKSVLAVLIAFIPMFFFAQEIYAYVAKPLIETMPDGASMIATDVASPFLAPFKLTLVLAFFVAIPAVLYQVWAFIAPGLYKNEKRLVAPLLISSTLLFYTGMAFAYYVVFPVAFLFFSSVAPEGVAVSTDIASYLNFVLKLFFAFGIAFEVPVAIVLMCWTGMATADGLRAKRPFVIIGVFCVGMLLTPPDPLSQLILAIPMWLLFEVGVIIGSIYSGKNDDELEEQVSERE
ncbi:MAG: twin-arginine translocase subunit TatC [Pseudomonadota bacterium]